MTETISKRARPLPSTTLLTMSELKNFLQLLPMIKLLNLPSIIKMQKLTPMIFYLLRGQLNNLSEINFIEKIPNYFKKIKLFLSGN